MGCSRTRGGFMKNAFSMSALGNVFNDSAPNLKRRIFGIYALLIALNITVWLVSIFAFAANYPKLLGVALLAYTFGLRHSVDADHISAIDNVTRKLMQERRRQAAVRPFSPLGHSTI